MTLSRRQFSLLSLSLPFLALTAHPARAATHQVSIKSMKFNPKTINISAGDKVVFLNEDNAPHTATAKNGSFDTGRLGQGQKASVTFDTPGELAFFCAVHPMMKGKIVVA